MARVYLLKIPREKEKNVLFHEINFDTLPCSVKDKILTTGDVKTKIERLYAYSLLIKKLGDFGLSAQMIDDKLFFDEKGKPFVKDFGLEFSVSHTDGMVAVAVSSDGAIGIDIEKTDKEKKEKISKIINRFCRGIILAQKIGCLEISAYSDNNGKITETNTPRTLNFDESNADFVKWTQLEAALKCHGGGFEALCEIKDTFSSYSTESALIAHCGEIYAISVANKRL